MLITLAIIGVVAALTIPTLVSNYKKKVVETSLRQTYSIVNEAIKLSEIDNGPAEYWDYPSNSYNSNSTDEFLEKYIKPYIHGYINPTVSTTSYSTFYLKNGTCLNWAMVVPNMNMEVFVSFGNKTSLVYDVGGKDFFLFYFLPEKGEFTPAGYNLPQTKEAMTAGSDGNSACNPDLKGLHNNCARLIMLDGWKINDDYPFKF